MKILYIIVIILLGPIVLLNKGLVFIADRFDDGIRYVDFIVYRLWEWLWDRV